MMRDQFHELRIRVALHNPADCGGCRAVGEPRIQAPDSGTSPGAGGEDGTKQGVDLMNFVDQYKHPNWQKKRLEALSEANYTCQRCFNKEAQLHVHHKRYVKGRMIWEYSLPELSVLCADCHDVSHQEKDVLMSLIASLDVMAIEEIIGLLAGYCSEITGPANADVSGPLCFSCNSLSVKAGIAAARFVNESIKGGA